MFNNKQMGMNNQMNNNMNNPMNGFNNINNNFRQNLNPNQFMQNPNLNLNGMNLNNNNNFRFNQLGNQPINNNNNNFGGNYRFNANNNYNNMNNKATQEPNKDMGISNQDPALAAALNPNALGNFYRNQIIYLLFFILHKIKLNNKKIKIFYLKNFLTVFFYRKLFFLRNMKVFLKFFKNKLNIIIGAAPLQGTLPNPAANSSGQMNVADPNNVFYFQKC